MATFSLDQLIIRFSSEGRDVWLVFALLLTSNVNHTTQPHVCPSANETTVELLHLHRQQHQQQHTSLQTQTSSKHSNKSKQISKSAASFQFKQKNRIKSTKTNNSVIKQCLEHLIQQSACSLFRSHSDWIDMFLVYRVSKTYTFKWMKTISWLGDIS